ncbi:MAG: signal recognition particle-docking protein FtsY [Verrucomicrobia bacterium]|nr:signal recognition particle-docking protein FtsY [Verrucomicrobiota bacterium]MBS0637327.1 signal recognition particle-docking protein FtsY [Verrucomicrobiota bacterium]
MVFGFLKNSFNAIKSALKKTRSFFADRLSQLFSKKIDQEVLDELEELFYEADLGVKLSAKLTNKTKEYAAKHPDAKSDELIGFLRQELTNHLTSLDSTLAHGSPLVILIVGVNGNGKTSSIAKLAKYFKNEGKKVLVAGGDTFRAGAQEQLAIWAERLGVDIVSANYKSDPASVAFDAVSKAVSKHYDVLLLDTAGRLENKTHLMKELEKIRRSMQKHVESAPQETLLVMDATVGQNGVEQAKAFHQSTPLTGIILTKLDGTAKGGTAFAITEALNIPIKFISYGEQVDDFAPFDPTTFVQALLPLD